MEDISYSDAIGLPSDLPGDLRGDLPGDLAFDLHSDEVGGRGWSVEEHGRFLEALEKYGDGNTGSEWQYMAKYVGQRTPNEIQLHAHKYFIKLQAATQRKKRSGGMAGGDHGVLPDPTMGLDDRNWTKREELVFENALATHDEHDEYDARDAHDESLSGGGARGGCGGGRWAMIASLLPGKSPEDIRMR